MDNKEKMLRGELYLLSDETLVYERLKAKSITYEFNNTHPSETTKREAIIRKLFGNTGKNVWIEPTFQCDYGYNISVGDNFYANHNCVFLDCAPITIGDNVFIAPSVNIYTATHPLDAESRNKFLEYAKPVTIGNNVWIGGNATILPGVTIGDNVVIGAGSVVTKDIPSNVIAYGNPCKQQTNN